MHAPGEPGDLPYTVGCPAFTRELRQVQWPSTKNFKPDVSEKYDGKTHPSEFLSIYTIAVQAAGGRDDKILANYFPLVLKPNVRSWLMHLLDNSISSWQTYAISLSAPLQAATSLMARRVIFICSPRRKESPCASTFRDSAVCSTTSQTSTLPR